MVSKHFLGMPWTPLYLFHKLLLEEPQDGPKMDTLDADSCWGQSFQCGQGPPHLFFPMAYSPAMGHLPFCCLGCEPILAVQETDWALLHYPGTTTLHSSWPFLPFGLFCFSMPLTSLKVSIQWIFVMCIIAIDSGSVWNSSGKYVFLIFFKL